MEFLSAIITGNIFIMIYYAVRSVKILNKKNKHRTFFNRLFYKNPLGHNVVYDPNADLNFVTMTFIIMNGVMLFTICTACVLTLINH